MTSFQGRLRVRANGILIEQDQVLLVKLNAETRSTPFWMPPGGGVHFGETLEQAVAREFREEVGLQIQVDALLFVSQFVKDTWHALEFYFQCTRVNGTPKLGHDPELHAQQQILQDLAWFPLNKCAEIPIVPDYLCAELPLLNKTGNVYPKYFSKTE